MIVENWKTELEKNLPDVEKYLTSVLQEEAKITVTSAESFDTNNLSETLNKNDIFVFAMDQTNNCPVIIILDKEWFGLLSSIMIGVEEKENNEITRDLLTKFSSELSVTLTKSLRRNGIRFTIGDIEVLTFKQFEKKFKKGEYFYAKMDVDGLADDSVRAEVLLGNPEDQAAEQESDESASDDSQSDQAGDDSSKKKTEGQKSEKPTAAKGQDKSDQKKDAGQSDDDSASEQLFTSMDTDHMDEEGDGNVIDDDQVISGRKVDFDDFEEPSNGSTNGHSRSMALLKDVEMDVSVQLGQIEMPLGKVLQLAKGSIIELDKLAGEPVDILVNGSKIAQGEVVVIDEHFGVRITNLITTKDRIARLK